MAHFEKRSYEENTWTPNICDVDFSQRLAKFMGDVALDGTEIYTAWLIADEDFEIQVTPESARAFISLVDDDSDTITVLDPRDSLWFNFMRITHPDSFEQVLQLVMPWAQVTTGITPAPEVYTKFLDTISKDTETDDLHIPEGWDE